MKISPGLRGGNWLAGGSLLTVTAILVRIQAEREGGDMFRYVLRFLYNVPFFRAARGTPASQRISAHGYGNFGSQRNGRVGILFCCVSTFLYH